MNNKNIKALPVKVKKEYLVKLKGCYYEVVDLYGYDFDKNINEFFIIHVKSKEDLYKIDRVNVKDIRFRNIDNILKSDVNDNNIIAFFNYDEAVGALNKLIKVNFIDENYREYKYEDVFN